MKQIVDLIQCEDRQIFILLAGIKWTWQLSAYVDYALLQGRRYFPGRLGPMLKAAFNRQHPN